MENNLIAVLIRTVRISLPLFFFLQRKLWKFYGHDEVYIFSTIIKFFKYIRIFLPFKINLKIIVLYLFAELFDWILKVDRVKIEIII